MRRSAGPRQPPFLGEPVCILIEQFPHVETIAGERPAAEMVDEQITRGGQLKPRLADPFREIIVVEQPSPNRSSSPPTRAYKHRES